MSLISREALLAFESMDAKLCASCGEHHTAEDVIMMIKTAPAIDAVPVVRCRECKHAWIHPCGYVFCHRDGRNAYEMTFNLDSFCSYGERKEGADNG